MGLRRPALGLVAAVIAGAAVPSCGGDRASGELAGASQHFRLFLGGMLPAAVDPQEELERLETNWADTRTVLQMPAGQIDYVLLASDQIAAACGISEAAGCESQRTVYTSALVDQHELNHAYMDLRTAHRPHPLLVEGIAEAVGCGEGAEPPPAFAPVADWRGLIAGANTGDLYGPGRQLARYLLLAYGADRFLSYYQQAPRTEDAEAFSSNFSRFWAVDLDSVWAAMQTAQPPWGPAEVLPLCPCSLPAWSASATPGSLVQTPSTPYWTWPSPAPGAAVLAGYQGSFAIHDCARRDLQEFSSLTMMFARLDGAFYASEGSAVAIASGSYVSDTCAGALVYEVPRRAVLANAGGSPIAIAVQRPPGAAVSAYVALTTAVPLALGTYDGAGQVVVCPDCQTPDAACQPVPAYPASVQVTGTFDLHWTDGPPSPSTDWPYSFVTLWVGPTPAAAPQRARVIW